jgi:hypothetical protein
MRLRIFSTVVAILLLSLSAAAAPALAGVRKVPFGFFGTTLDPTETADATQSQLDGQTALMARSGVETLRLNLSWSEAEPEPGVYDWAPSDRLVMAAALHGLSLLPIVEFTPLWAAPANVADPTYWLPAHPSVFGTFMTALVDRYGPHGTLWESHPKLRRYAVHFWQIWNEPAGDYDWNPAPWPKSYTTLLKIGYKAVHRADPRAKVVSGSVVGLILKGVTQTPWGEARAMYKAGAGRYFNVLAINAYTDTTDASVAAQQSVKLVQYVRNVMKHHGDAHKPIWVTELTWSAAKGKIPPKEYSGFSETERGQAARMTDYYEDLAKDRSLGVRRALWYTWASSYSLKDTVNEPPVFAFSGLVKWRPGRPFSPLPILSTFQKVAANLEGCRKSSNATKCA